MILEPLGQSSRVPQYMLPSAALAWTLQGCFPQRKELHSASESSVVPSKPQVLKFGIHGEFHL